MILSGDKMGLFELIVVLQPIYSEGSNTGVPAK